MMSYFWNIMFSDLVMISYNKLKLVVVLAHLGLVSSLPSGSRCTKTSDGSGRNKDQWHSMYLYLFTFQVDAMQDVMLGLSWHAQVVIIVHLSASVEILPLTQVLEQNENFRINLASLPLKIWLNALRLMEKMEYVAQLWLLLNWPSKASVSLYQHWI